MSNQPDLERLYLAPSGPPWVHVSYIFAARYTTYGGKMVPLAAQAYITEVADFELFIIRSGYLVPRFIITFFRPGSSAKFVSS